jgi:uncharacterized membrane protein
MEAMLRLGDFAAGVLSGIRAVSARLVEHYPSKPNDKNELDNKPIVL